MSISNAKPARFSLTQMTPTTINMLDNWRPPDQRLANLDDDKQRPGLREITESDKAATIGADRVTTSTANAAKHWRVRYLRHSSVAETNRGIPGVTPPYCPAGPPLLREVFEDGEDSALRPWTRSRSPLRFSAAVSESESVNIKYDLSSDTRSHPLGGNSYRKMPHAVSLAQTGFQALILCGPGIGLGTFTSVPSEYPKALINVANRPMVWYVLDWCYRMGVTDITLITPPTAKATFAAALAQNPYLTSLPSPSPTLLCPEHLEFTTPTAELLRLPEVQTAIKSDFILLPCDLICDIQGDGFLESYLTNMAGLGGIAAADTSSFDRYLPHQFSPGGEGSRRRGGLSIWYNTADREESVKGEECDFLATVKIDSTNVISVGKNFNSLEGSLRNLVWTMPMSELLDQVEEDKSWKIRQSLLRKYGSVKCMTRFRDSHIYFFPYWVKEFAAVNQDFESVSEDLVGTWAKSEWRKPNYRAKIGAQQIFATAKPSLEDSQTLSRPIEDEIDFTLLSSTQVTQHVPNITPSTKPVARLASRVQAKPQEAIISSTEDADTQDTERDIPIMPPILSHILPSDPTASLVRRVDTTPLLLSVSLLLAKTPSIEDTLTATVTSPASPFAHPSKIAGTATIAPRTTISRLDTLIDSNSSIATQCVIKSSCIGSNVSIGAGTRITGCVIMDGATVGEKCVLTNTVVGKKCKIGKTCVLQGCEVQDGNVLGDRTEGKGEKYLVGGLEDEVEGEEFDYGGGEDDEDGEDGTYENDAGQDEDEEF